MKIIGGSLVLWIDQQTISCTLKTVHRAIALGLDANESKFEKKLLLLRRFFLEFFQEVIHVRGCLLSSSLDGFFLRCNGLGQIT